MAKGKSSTAQPKFDNRIFRLIFPLTGPTHFGRGYMIWDKPITGYSDRATVNFLYNPSVVSAQFAMSDPNAAASLLFPNAHDNLDLRIPLNQTVSWSILYDRTYELWGQYNHDGTAKQTLGSQGNNPAVIGVLADIFQMQQFTGMNVQFQNTGNSVAGAPKSSFTKHQGILQLIPSFVYFGGKDAASYYGFVSEWDYQITHWTQHMVPMRCVINISFTMLPPPSNISSGPSPSAPTGWGRGGGGVGHPIPPGPPLPSATALNGRSGR